MSSRLWHVFEYPRLYAGAVRARSHLRGLGPLEPAAALDVARSYRWPGGNVAPTQATDEILWLLEQVRALQPKRILEIGTDEGGTLFLWSRIAPPDAHLVALDIRPLGLLGQWSSWAFARRGLGYGDQRITLAMPLDSHSSATVDRIRGLFDGEEVDFLFIDADHSYEGVKRDFELYAPLVRSGGLVAFHDIASPPWPGVVQFWEELRQTHDVEERIAETQPSYGIGVVRIS